MLIIFFASCSRKDNKLTPSDDAIDLVKTELNTFSRYLPIEGGIGLLITDVEYDEATYTIQYKYQYTVPGVHKPSESQINEAKKLAVGIILQQPKEKKLLEQGFSFRYDYYSLDDEYLFTQQIALEDIKDI